MINRIQKLFRFFFVERPGQVRVALCVVLLAVLFMETKAIARQQKSLQVASAQKTLVLQIPAMEERLRILQEQSRLASMPAPEENLPPPPPPKFTGKLTGTISNTDHPIAFIDDKTYEIGSVIGDYKIIDITQRIVVLENLISHVVERVYLQE